MNTNQKKVFVDEVIEHMVKNRVFDLLSLNENDDSIEIIICNFWKIQKNKETMSFFEKDCLGLWQRVPFLKAPFRILDNNGVALADSIEMKSDIQVKSWVQESVTEIVRHVVEKSIQGSTCEKSFEYFLIKEVVGIVTTCDKFADQQLLNPNFSEIKQTVVGFHRVIKQYMLDESLNKCLSNLRDDVTLFEFTFTLPNKQRFLQYGQNWMNILPSLAKAQTECLLLSKKGCFVETCKDWVEEAGNKTEWDKDVPFHLQSYIKHIPVNSLRAVIGKNISHILAILQLANVDPTASVGFFTYVGKSLNEMEISASDYNELSDVIGQVYAYTINKVDNGYGAILSMCHSGNLISSLLAEYREAGKVVPVQQTKAHQALRSYMAATVIDDFDKLVAKQELTYYSLGGVNSVNYVSVLGNPNDNFQFQLYEKCVLLIGDTEKKHLDHDDLEWWYFHLDDYRVLISIVQGEGVEQGLCNLYSNKALNKDEIVAIKGIVRNIEKKRVKKDTT